MVAPDRDPDHFIDQIEQVTPADVQRVANTYLKTRSPNDRLAHS